MILKTSDATWEERGCDPVPAQETQTFKGILCNSSDRLVLLGSGPAVGNTALSLEFALEYAISNDKAVYIFSLEMSAIHIYHRLLSLISSVSLNKIIDRNYSDEEEKRVLQAQDKLSSLNIIINDVSYDTSFGGRGIKKITDSIDEFEKPEFDEVGLVIIDYLQLMSYNYPCADTVKEMTKITKCLKKLARSKKMIVLANVHLGRRWPSTRQKRHTVEDFQRLLGDLSPVDMIITVWRNMWNERGEYDFGGDSYSEITVHKTKDGRFGTTYFTRCSECLKLTPKSENNQ